MLNVQKSTLTSNTEKNMNYYYLVFVVTRLCVAGGGEVLVESKNLFQLNLKHKVNLNFIFSQQNCNHGNMLKDHQKIFALQQ